MNRREMTWIAVAMISGIVIAVFAFRMRYRIRREEHRHGMPDVRQTPPYAQPRYVGFGEYYDPYALWPYGPSSNYQLFLSRNSGVPTTEVPNPGFRSPATAPPVSIFGGNGSGGGRSN